MKKEELDELECFRRSFALAAENASSPYVAREIARLVDDMAKVSGPTKPRQRAIAARDRALRSLYAIVHKDLSIRSGAGKIASAAARYTETRLKHDRDCCRRPVGGVEQIVFDASLAGLGKFPSARALERVLAE